VRFIRSLAPCLALGLVGLVSAGCGGAALIWAAVTGDPYPYLHYAIHRGTTGLEASSFESASIDFGDGADAAAHVASLADELALHREGRGSELVVLHRVAVPRDGAPGVVLDAILAGLEVRGLDYDLVSVERGDDPTGLDASGAGRFEALLVRADVVWMGAQGGPSAEAGHASPWVGCDLLLGGELVRVVATAPVGEFEGEVTVADADPR
jgi:hypothetical protein